MILPQLTHSTDHLLGADWFHLDVLAVADGAEVATAKHSSIRMFRIELGG